MIRPSMAVWRRELGLRVRPSRKSNMRRLSYEWLAGLREIMIDPVRCPLAYEEFRLKEFERDRDGTWVDEIPDGNDHSIDAVRYAVMDDVLRGGVRWSLNNVCRLVGARRLSRIYVGHSLQNRRYCS